MMNLNYRKTIFNANVGEVAATYLIAGTLKFAWPFATVRLVMSIRTICSAIAN